MWAVPARRHSLLLVLVFLVSALYAAAEWWSAGYLQEVIRERRLHNFDRALFIVGVQAGGVAIRDADGRQGRRSEVASVQDAQLLSAASLDWLRARDDLESVHTIDVTVMDVSVAGQTLPQVFLYGIDDAVVEAFRLGDPALLDNGSLVLSDGAAVGLGSGVLTGRDSAVLTLPEVVLSQVAEQVPPEMVPQLRALRSVLPLAHGQFADPYARRGKRNVAYLHRDAARLSGMTRPVQNHVLLVREGVAVDDARAEIAAYLSHQERSSLEDIQPAVMTVDEYLPPLVSIDELRRWVSRFRIALVVGLLAFGFGIAWMELRRHAFEIALHRALGATRKAAFQAVYGSWLGRLLLAAVVGATLVWLPAAFAGVAGALLPAVAVFVGACTALAVGTLIVVSGVLRRDPMRTLSHGL